MAALYYVQLERLLEGCKGIRVIANQWAYAAPSDTHALVMWYPFRRVEVDGDRAAPLAIAMDGDAFPVGSYAVDKSLCRILCRKDSRGWYRTDEPVTSREVLTAELEIINQKPYTRGQIPAVTPVWFNAPLPEAKLGKVEDPDSAAFGGLFADPDEKEKFTIRIRLPGKEHDSKQYNLQRRGKPIPRHELGRIVSDEVERALQKDDLPLQVNGRKITFEELILVDVYCVSRGSVQVTLATRYYSTIPLL